MISKKQDMITPQNDRPVTRTISQMRDKKEGHFGVSNNFAARFFSIVLASQNDLKKQDMITPKMTDLSHEQSFKFWTRS